MLIRNFRLRLAVLIKSATVFVCLCFSAVAPAHAQWVQLDSIFPIYGPPGGPTWTHTISFDAFATIGSNLFAGGFWPWGSIYLSSDNGEDWSNVTSYNIGYDTVAPTWIGLGALFANGTSLFTNSGAEILLSTDSGASWSEQGVVGPGLNQPNLQINAFAAIGTNIFVGESNGGRGGVGVYLSTDSGKTWAVANNGLTDNQIFSLAAMGPILFAGDEDNQIFRSTNNGTSWTLANNGLPSNLQYGLGYGLVTSFAVMGTYLYAGIFNGNSTDSVGVFLSTDSGQSWIGVNNGLTGREVSALAVSCSNLFAGTPNGIFRSTDLGKNWTPINSGLPITNDAYALGVCGTNLFEAPYDIATGPFKDGAYPMGIWRLSWVTLAELLPAGSSGDTMQATVCGSNFSIVSQYTGTCTFATLDSVFIAGLDSSEYQISHTHRSSNENLPDTSWITLNPIQTGFRSLTLTAQYLDDENNILDTSFTLTLDVVPEPHLSLYLMPNQLSVQSQGLVSIPIYASSTAPVTGWSITLRINMRTDLLTPESITSPVGATAESLQIDSGGAWITLTLPPNFSISTDTLIADVICRAFVTDTTKTPITLTGVTISNSTPNCLSIGGSGQSFTLMPGCGTTELTQFMSTGALPPAISGIDPNPATTFIKVEGSAGPFKIFDPLGRNYEMPCTANTLDVSSIPPGVYFVTDGCSRAKFVKE